MNKSVGVTGHRILIEIDRLIEGIDYALHAIEAEYSGQELSLLSCLAEGSDRLAARRALRRGWHLQAVLPLPQTEYEADFTSPASLAEFRSLLAQASSVTALDGLPRLEAYAAANRYLLDRFQALLAVWDGQTAQGAGGTGELVAEARRRGLPLAWVHAGNRKPGTIEATSLGEEQGKVSFEGFPNME